MKTDLIIVTLVRKYGGRFDSKEVTTHVFDDREKMNLFVKEELKHPAFNGLSLAKTVLDHRS